MDTFRYRLKGSTIRPTPILDMIHIAYVPDFGVYFKAEVGRKFKYYTVGLQMVLLGMERRKAWRLLQRKAGVGNKDYPAQNAMLEKVEKGELTRDELINEEVEATKA